MVNLDWETRGVQQVSEDIVLKLGKQNCQCVFMFTVDGCVLFFLVLWFTDVRMSLSIDVMANCVHMLGVNYFLKGPIHSRILNAISVVKTLSVSSVC